MTSELSPGVSPATANGGTAISFPQPGEGAGEAWQGSGYVFTNELGEPYYPGYFSDAWERRIAALGFPKIRLHDARHSCFSAMLKDGTTVKVVQELAGHSSPTVTLDVYAHVLPGMAKEAGERMSAQHFG